MIFFRIRGNQVSDMAVGNLFAAWLCIYAFDVDHPPKWLQIPPHFTWNGKLKSIPTLKKDLQITFYLYTCMTKEKNERFLLHKASEGRKDDPLLSSESIAFTHSHVGKLDQSLNELMVLVTHCSHHDATNESAQDSNSQPIVSRGIMIDLNIPIAYSDDEIIEKDSEFLQTSNGSDDQNALDSDPAESSTVIISGARGKEKKQRKKRALKRYLDSLTRKDLAKYFHLNRERAAAALNMGMTLFRKKCLELGIKRWPYTKIKVLDVLSKNIQDEAEMREQKKLPVVSCLEEWREQLNSEREKIERNPSSKLDLKTIKLKWLIRKRYKTVFCNQAQGA